MKSYDVVVLADVDQQIDRETAWWGKRSPHQAAAIDDALEAAFRLLSRFPEIGHPIERRGVWSQTDRIFRLEEIRYFIVYRIEEKKERIIVTRFRHEKRRPLKRL